MDFKSLTRNPDLINNIWVKNENTVSTKKRCTILIPYRYLAYKLATIGDKINILSVAMVYSGNEYFILNGCCWLWITPSATEQKKIGGEEFLLFHFNAGDIVSPDLTTVKDSDLLYDMNKYFYSNARIPFYLNQDDVGNLFLYHKEYGGMNISPNNIPFELITSVVCHDDKDKFKFYRHSDMKRPPMYFPFGSVLFNTSNTVAKLLGANLEDGVTSALVAPAARVEPIEQLLKL